MRTAIRKIGNSQGVLIPKPLLAEAARELARAGDDAAIWPGFANAEDASLKW